MQSTSRKYGDFENRYGHFSPDGYEYVITRPDTPRPWTNVISNGDFGLVVSQAGGGFSWRTHVSLNRLTRWNQDLVRDDWGKWLYLRDLQTGELRSLSFQPVQAEYRRYRARHGLGYTVFEQQFKDFKTEWTLFAAREDSVEIWIVKLKNTGIREKHFQLCSYLEWNLGAAPDINREFHKIFIETAFSEKLKAIYATKTLWEVPTSRGHWNTDWPYLGFHSINRLPAGWDTSKDALIGRHGSYHDPKGIIDGNFTQHQGRFQDACAALAVNLELAPQAEETVIFLLGQPDYNLQQPAEEQFSGLISKYSSLESAAAELQNVKNYWREITGCTTVETPDPSFDLLVNIWLKYQVISGHLWARTGYFQQSGAYGFRDQMQSSQIWLAHDPQKMLDHALLNARHQFTKGTVLHWWHPLTEQGLATNMTDDLLWLPYMLNRYFRETGNYEALQQSVPFYDEGMASLQEHCIRAIDVVLERFSPRGLPLIGEGDWCDGFSAVGLDWKGESIWLGMFLYGVLQDWSAILEKHSSQPDPQRAVRYRQRAAELKEALNTAGWNGQWYLAATKDDGTPIGDPSQEECKIYLMSQTWAIINRVAKPERAEQVAAAFLKHLESDNGLQLFSPAFSKPDPFIGYITRYAPGLRENGGVYTHAATWGVMALARMKKAEEAFRIFQKLNPILQTEQDVE
ncbi:MAG: glycosyl transferase family 36, partial [Calditrichia bacterium]